jgi:hypothetical protein
MNAQDAAALCKNLPYDIVSLHIKSLRIRLPHLARWKLEAIVDSCEVQARLKEMPTQVLLQVHVPDHTCKTNCP